MEHIHQMMCIYVVICWNSACSTCPLWKMLFTLFNFALAIIIALTQVCHHLMLTCLSVDACFVTEGQC